MNRVQYALAAFVQLATLAATDAAGGLRPCDVARPLTRPEGAPRPSDVIMRSLRLHPANAKDPHDTFAALQTFHVTRLAWAYITDRKFIARVRETGRVFGGAAAAPAYLPAADSENWFEKVVIVDLKARPIIAPWKRTWKPTLWGCVNNPELERGYMAYLKKYIDAGAQVMQRDEPTANLSATQWGGCFCEHCVRAFRAWLKANVPAAALAKMGIGDVDRFDVREYFLAKGAPAGDAFRQWKGGEIKKRFEAFQTEATTAFHRRTRKALDEYARRHVPMSCNNGARRWSKIEEGFDWVFGELAFRHATPVYLDRLFAAARTHAKVQVVTMPKKGDRKDLAGWQRRTRQTIAMTYALGGLCMVPWDVYMPHDAPRYFGTAKQYADLYGFVRGAARWLDGYEHAGTVGKGVTCDRYGQTGAAVTFPTGASAFAVLRAKPGQPDAPVVVHVVDWSDRPAPITLRLDVRRLIGGEGAVRLLTPAEFDAARHARAEATGDFAPLVREQAVRIRADGTIALPQLAPWSMLIVTPAGKVGR